MSKRTLPRARVYAKTGGKCVYCGDMAEAIEHLIPKCKGGSNNIENLFPSCNKCNLSKGSKTIHDFKVRLHLDNLGLIGMSVKYYDQLVLLGISKVNIKFVFEELIIND